MSCATNTQKGHIPGTVLRNRLRNEQLLLFLTQIVVSCSENRAREGAVREPPGTIIVVVYNRVLLLPFLTWTRKDMGEEGSKEGKRRGRRSGLHTNSNNPTLKGGEQPIPDTPWNSGKYVYFYRSLSAISGWA